MNAPVPMVPPGPAEVTGSCQLPEGYPDWGAKLQYSDVAVDVASPFYLQVFQGTSVSAGSLVRVNAIGGECPRWTEPDISLYSKPGTDVADGRPSTLPGWQWSLLVPNTLKAGRYQLEEDCFDGNQTIAGTYRPLTITIGSPVP
jgi:hypothetical protein